MAHPTTPQTPGISTQDLFFSYYTEHPHKPSKINSRLRMSVIHLTPRQIEDKIPKSLLPASCRAVSAEEYQNNQVAPLIWLIFGGTGSLGRQVSKLAIGRRDKVLIAALDKVYDKDDAIFTAEIEKMEAKGELEPDKHPKRSFFETQGMYSENEAKRARQETASRESPSEKRQLPNPFLYIGSEYKNSCSRVECDVRIRSSVDEAVKKCMDLYGRIDVVVNCFGYGVVGACEDQIEPEVRSQFEVNFMGLFHTLRAVLPYLTTSARSDGEELQSNGSHSQANPDNPGTITGTPGHIISFTSSMGVLGAPGFGPYSATRWAAEGLLESLAIEVEHLGCKVTIIETGYSKTPEDEIPLRVARP